MEINKEGYININNLINQTNKIYQIQLNNNFCIIKNIGKAESPPDIIIKENFGNNNNLSLYSCVYNNNEIINNKIMYPIIKLINKEKDNEYTSSIGIKFIEKIDLEKNLKDFELYFVKNLEKSEFIINLKINEEINKDNIIEKIIELSFKY
jgi:hypothetical protein